MTNKPSVMVDFDQKRGLIVFRDPDNNTKLLEIRTLADKQEQLISALLGGVQLVGMRFG